MENVYFLQNEDPLLELSSVGEKFSQIWEGLEIIFYP